MMVRLVQHFFAILSLLVIISNKIVSDASSPDPTFAASSCTSPSSDVSTSPKHEPAFSLGVRDSLMIAHSFHKNPAFGPAGGMHGATYTCDVEFQSDELHPDNNWVIDIGLASNILSDVLKRYNLQNLDEIFDSPMTDDGSEASRKPILTTTEFMARQIHNDIVARLQEEAVSGGVFRGRVRVKLWESHKAWATYTGPSV